MPAPNFRELVSRRNPDIDLIAALFRKLTKDEPLVGDDEIAKTVGRKVENIVKWGHMVSTAIRRVEREDGIVIVRVRGEKCYKLAEAAEIVGTLQDGQKRIHRMANRRARRIPLVDKSKLTTDQKRQFDLSATALGVLAFMTKPNTLKRIEAAVRTKEDRLAIGSVLDVLK